MPYDPSPNKFKRAVITALWSYLVVHSIEVGEEALVIPPPSMGNLCTDVPGVGGAEAPFIVVPGEGVLRRPTEPVHVQAVVVYLVLNAARDRGRLGQLLRAPRAQFSLLPEHI